MYVHVCVVAVCMVYVHTLALCCPSTSFTFSQRTLMVLNVSGNGLDTLTELKCLAELTVLLAANNELDSLGVGLSVCLSGVCSFHMIECVCTFVWLAVQCSRVHSLIAVGK